MHSMCAACLHSPHCSRAANHSRFAALRTALLERLILIAERIQLILQRAIVCRQSIDLGVQGVYLCAQAFRSLIGIGCSRLRGYRPTAAQQRHRCEYAD